MYVTACVGGALASSLNRPPCFIALSTALFLSQSLSSVERSTTVSPTDIWNIGKLPVGAIPTDAIFYGGTATGQATFTAKLGTSASPSLFFASATYSNAVYRPTTKRLGTSAQISLSDDKMPRFVPVQLVGSAGATLGYLGDLVIYYVMPSQGF